MAGRELKHLFRAYREGDELAFRRAAQEIIAEEEAKNHLALARDLRKIMVGGADAVLADMMALPAPPTDREGEWHLAEPRRPERSFAELVLADAAIQQLNTITAEVGKWDLIDLHGVPRRQRVLFYGPPGCGKTSAGEALASELGWPLLIVRVDAVVSSYLGETASNLRRIFQYAATGSWILFFDEFDALGKARDDPNEHGEIKRVVTAFLQMLDSFRGSSLIVAATNHEHLLDTALWRRFDEVIEFRLPSVHEARKLLRQRLRGVRHDGVQIEKAASRLRGLPHSAVEKVVFDARRAALVTGSEGVNDEHLQSAVTDALRRPW